METQNTQVNKLKKDIKYNGIYFLDEDSLERIMQLRHHFSEEIIDCVKMRMDDPRSQKDLLSALNSELNKIKTLH